MWGQRWRDDDPWTRWLLWVAKYEWSINVLLEPRDLWVGAYIKGRYWEMGHQRLTFYVCPLPCLAIVVDMPVPRIGGHR